MDTYYRITIVVNARNLRLFFLRHSFTAMDNTFMNKLIIDMELINFKFYSPILAIRTLHVM